MDIKEVLRIEFEKIVESGFIEEKISESLKKLMSSVISDTLNGYGSDFQKGIKEKLSVALNADIKQLTIPEYHTKILSVVQDEIDIALKYEVENSLRERVKEFFHPIEDREYTISEIVEMFKEDIKDEFTDDYDHIPESHEITAFTSEGRSSDGYYYLHLDKDPDKGEYACSHRININNNGIWMISVNDADLLKTKHTILKNFDRFLYQAYSQKVKIKNDSDEIDNYICSDCD